ncbi:hypothetical protein WMF31_31500 [Sorangium sp. So ce1036]|uniref:hypothetical protein n=1 Tax=Sorangium sp. So ce1036 TaxID=3133328 RepID=UPI003F00C145
MSSIHYGTSLLMLVAAAMAGCAVESADLSDGEMGEDIEMVDSSEEALETADGAAIMNPQMGSQQIAGLGAAPVSQGIIQKGFEHPQKGFINPHKGLTNPHKGLISSQAGLVGSQTGLQTGLVGSQTGLQTGLVGSQTGLQTGLVGSQTGLVGQGKLGVSQGVGQYGQCPTKKGAPSKFCPSVQKGPSKFCPSCPSQQSPIYPQK